MDMHFDDGKEDSARLFNRELMLTQGKTGYCVKS
jgi:hypothetical protein